MVFKIGHIPLIRIYILVLWTATCVSYSDYDKGKSEDEADVNIDQGDSMAESDLSEELFIADLTEDLSIEDTLETDTQTDVSADDTLPVDSGEMDTFQPDPACPADMVHIEAFCIDKYEAPNIAGEYPLVMQSALDGDAWCLARGKRLCLEDEWIRACKGPNQWKYPYGDMYEDGRCNDDKIWREYNQAALNTWPDPEAQDEVARLYQAEPSGLKTGCVSTEGVYDLTGNIEEWTIRTQPHPNPTYENLLQGCYWSGCYGGAKPTCASTNSAHASAFRFYETGFRCCQDALQN